MWYSAGDVGWLGGKNPFTTCGSGQPTASWKCSLVQSWERNSVSPPLILYFYFFIAVLLKVFPLPACLSHCKKKKEHFWLWEKAEKKKLGFLNVQKAIVLVKLLTVSWVFLNCWTKIQPAGGIFYTKDEETKL